MCFQQALHQTVIVETQAAGVCIPADSCKSLHALHKTSQRWLIRNRWIAPNGLDLLRTWAATGTVEKRNRRCRPVVVLPLAGLMALPPGTPRLAFAHSQDDVLCRRITPYPPYVPDPDRLVHGRCRHRVRNPYRCRHLITSFQLYAPACAWLGHNRRCRHRARNLLPVHLRSTLSRPRPSHCLHFRCGATLDRYGEVRRHSRYGDGGLRGHQHHLQRPIGVCPQGSGERGCAAS